MDKWISIEDSLPATNDRVLMCLNAAYHIAEHVQIGVFVGPEKLNIFKLNDDTIVNVVTHWMKLPAMPV